MDVIDRLRRLARDTNVTSAAELRRFARERSIKHTAKELQEALRTNVAAQVLAPKAKFVSQSAAEQAGSRIQADLAEFPATSQNKNPKFKYALMATDVYTRQTYAEPLKNKTAEVTNAAMRKVLAKMPDEAKNAALTTDGGTEFKKVDEVLGPRGSTHRLKAGRNDIAVVDRAMQTLKTKLAVAKANKGGSWDKNLKNVVDSYNNNPRSAVHGAPAHADDANAQGFAVMQDNANRFVRNFEVSKAREAKLTELGGFRDAISDGSRQQKPRYGRVQQFESIEPGGLHVIAEDGTKALVKRVQPVDKTTEEPKAVFGTKELKRRIGLTPAEIQARLRRVRRMTGPIPATASRAFEEPAASSSSSSSAPIDRYTAMQYAFGAGPARVLSDEEKAARERRRLEIQAEKKAVEERKKARLAARDAKEAAAEQKRAEKAAKKKGK